MIGKITTGKSFKGCLQYCLNDKRATSSGEVKQDRVEMVSFNQCFGTEKELIAQFNAVRQLNTKLSKPVLHITLSLAPGEQLSKDKLMELCEQCAREMGFENNQYVAVQHNDTKHQHVHIVANRIGYDGRTVSDSNNFKKIAAFCRRMEKQYDLQQVLSPGKYLPKSLQQYPRNDLRKKQIKEDIRQSLSAATSYSDFESLMKAKDYEVIKGRGIAFRDSKKVYVKGSDLGYSLATIERLLGQKYQAENVGSSVIGSSHQTEPKKPFEQPLKPYDNRQLIPATLNTVEDAVKLLDTLLKSEQSGDYVPGDLTRKRKKKRKRNRL